MAMKYFKMLKKKLILPFYVGTIFFSFHCTSTVIERKDPILNSDLSLISDSLNRIVVSKHVNLYGKEIITNGKSRSVFEIEIINGQNIPGDDNGIEVLGKSIALLLKKSLKDPNEYDSYKVIFTEKATEGAVIKTHWKAKYFDSKNL